MKDIRVKTVENFLFSLAGRLCEIVAYESPDRIYWVKILPHQHIVTLRVVSFKVAENSFHYFSRLRVLGVIITTLYLLTPTSWYHKTAQSSGNKLPLILSHNRLPWQQYDLIKTPLNLALSAYNSKTSSVTPYSCTIARALISKAQVICARSKENISVFRFL